jgi:hypothetical protein
MTNDRDATRRSRFGAGSPNQVDRILVIACVVLWLAALGTGVAAVVALVGLARQHEAATSGGSDTPWLLYTVIGVSAAVILGAIPLLMRARQTATAGPSAPVPQSGPGRSGDAPAAALPLPPFGAPALRGHVTPANSRVGFPSAAVEQIWMRCSASIVGAMGAAATGIGLATYLMASDHDTASWSAYAVAAVITAAMPVAVWLYLRQLRDVLDASH